MFQRVSGIIDDLLGGDDDKMNLGINYEQGDKFSTSSLLNRDRIGLSLQSEISDKILINGKLEFQSVGPKKCNSWKCSMTFIKQFRQFKSKSF